MPALVGKHQREHAVAGVDLAQRRIPVRAGADHQRLAQPQPRLSRHREQLRLAVVGPQVVRVQPDVSDRLGVQLVLRIPLVDRAALLPTLHQLGAVEPFRPGASGVEVQRARGRLAAQLDAIRAHHVVGTLRQQACLRADADKNELRAERQAQPLAARVFNPVFELEQRHKLGVGACVDLLLVQRVVRVRRADVQGARARHGDMRLLAQPIPQLFASLGRRDVARHLDVVVLNLVGARTCHVRQDALRVHAGVARVGRARHPPLLDVRVLGQHALGQRVPAQHRLRVAARLVGRAVVGALMQDAVGRVAVVAPRVVNRQQR